MAIRMLKGVRTSFGAFEGGDIISGLSPVLESSLVSSGDAIYSADDKSGELARFKVSGNGYALVLGDGAVLATSELWPAETVRNYSATSVTVKSVPCEFGGFRVTAVTGTVNVFFKDALTATTVDPLQTQLAVNVGPYPLYGAGMNARRGNTVGLSYIMTGGGTISMEPMVI